MLNLKEEANKYHYLFIGQEATTGTHNRLTGRMSNYGSIYSFTNRREAKAFLDTMSLRYEEFAHIGKPSTLRQYFLGISLQSYYGHLMMLECSDLD